MQTSDSLNAEQRRAVEHGTGPLLVVAGAGTGKTRVITERIARLILNGGAEPETVLALTFTEKAAREMQDRLYGLIGWTSFRVPVMTFNAFGAELLGTYATHIGRSIRGGLINDIQKSLLLKQRFDDIEFEYYGIQPDVMEFLGRIVAYLGRLQNADISVEKYETYVAGLDKAPGEMSSSDVLEQRDLAKLYRLYEKIKTETGTFDYYDQLALPLRILTERPNLAERLGRQYRYVLVDEYQDTSPVQDHLLRTFVPPDGNLFAVGDDDQAIYSFRGAEIDNIRSFTRHFKVADPIALVHNYRSGQPILDAAYRLITHNNPARLEAELGLNKQLIATNEAATVKFVPYATPAEEQAAVISEISTRLHSGEPPSQIAVLARSNAALKAYAKALRVAAIPFAISTTVNVFEQRELIQLWHLLEWIGHRARDESIGHLMLGPYVSWSAAQWRTVIERSRHELIGVEEALRSLADEGDEAAQGVCRQLEQWRQVAAVESVARLSYRIVFEGGLVEGLTTSAEAGHDARVIRVFEDLHRLFEQMQDFETVETDGSLASYLATYPKPPELEASEAIGDAEGVQLLTVHASKGLEFDTVYVIGCTARAWSPSGNLGLEVPAALRSGKNLPPEHEQRRLMYVAATRARRALILSAPLTTSGGARQVVSPFVEELMGDTVGAANLDHGQSPNNSLQKLQQFFPLRAELPDKLPFETTDGWLELGVGDLALYAQDPHDFYLQKVLKISQPFGPQLAFGSAIHGAIQAFYEARMRGEDMPAEELEARLDELWSNQGYDSQTQAELARRRAKDALRRFRSRERAAERPVLSVEQPVQFELIEAKLRLRGRLDATFGSIEELEIRDFKTGNLRDSEAIVRRIKDASSRESFQLRTYALAAEQLTGHTPAEVVLDYVVTGAIGGTELSSRMLANHREKLVKLAERLRARDFAPAPASAFHQSAAYRYYGEPDEEGW